VKAPQPPGWGILVPFHTVSAVGGIIGIRRESCRIPFQPPTGANKKYPTWRRLRAPLHELRSPMARTGEIY